ncbi:MAG TPA: hypothetical protein VKB49_15320 [Candidatus Sulfotelmatobacter sp.]|nr:hypothetical protein [Candidatus Sulfotelmatobacter sp.]
MEKHGLEAALERINAGAPIPTIEPSQIEHVWERLSRIRRETQQNGTVGLTAVCGNPEFAPKNPDEQIALSIRYALLDALVERGVLDDYMNDASARQHVFVAAATIPCDGNDLAEALEGKELRETSRDVVGQTKEELKNAGSDVPRPKIVEKFIDWIRSHC